MKIDNTSVPFKWLLGQLKLKCKNKLNYNSLNQNDFFYFGQSTNAQHYLVIFFYFSEIKHYTWREELVFKF